MTEAPEFIADAAPDFIPDAPPISPDFIPDAPAPVSAAKMTVPDFIPDQPSRPTLPTTTGGQFNYGEAVTGQNITQGVKPAPVSTGWDAGMPPAGLSADGVVNWDANMRAVGPQTRPLPGPLEAIRGGLSQSALSTAGLAGRVTDAVGLTSDAANTAHRMSQGENIMAEERGQGTVGNIVQGASRSLGDAAQVLLVPGAQGKLAGAGASFAMKALGRINQARGLIASAVAKTANDATYQGQQSGLQGADLARHVATKSGIEGVVTGAMQAVGLGGFEGALLKRQASHTVGEALKRAGRDLAAEELEELTIYTAQAMEDYRSGVNPKALDPEQFWSGAGMTAAQTGLVSGVAATPDVVKGQRSQTSRSPVDGQQPESPSLPASQTDTPAAVSASRESPQAVLANTPEISPLTPESRLPGQAADVASVVRASAPTPSVAAPRSGESESGRAGLPQDQTAPTAQEVPAPRPSVSPGQPETPLEVRPAQAVSVDSAVRPEILQPSPDILPPSAPGAKGKEPWQMTQKEFVDSPKEKYYQRDSQRGRNLDKGPEYWQGISADTHKLIIEQAIKRGQPVSPEVLKDYPDLAPSGDAAKQKARYTAGLPEPTGAGRTTPPEGTPQATGGNEAIQLALKKRGVRGDNLLNVIDRADELRSGGGVIGDDGFVTLYHRTSKENADRIIKTGRMDAKEDGLFFGTAPTGQIEGYGDSVVKVRLPLEKIEVNDVFTNEVHVRLPLGSKRSIPIKAESWQPKSFNQPAPAKSGGVPVALESKATEVAPVEQGKGKADNAGTNPRYTAYLETTSEPSNAGFMGFIRKMAQGYQKSVGKSYDDSILNQDDFTKFIERSVSKSAQPFKSHTPIEGEGQGRNEPQRTLSAGRQAGAVSLKTKTEDVRFTDTEVEKRFREAEGLDKPSLWRKLMDTAADAKKGFTRHFVHLDTKQAEDAKLANTLRLREARVDSAPGTAAQMTKEFTKDLDRATGDYQRYKRRLMLPDILKDVEAGLYEGKELPFGFKDANAIKAQLATLEKQSSKRVQPAIDKRNAEIRKLTERQVELDLLPKDTLKDNRYYHRQVMQYVNMREHLATGGKGSGVKERTLGYQKGRVGGGDFNTAYEQAEHEYLTHALRQVATAETMKRIEADHAFKGKGVPEGYVSWSPKAGTSFARVMTVPDQILQKILAGERTLGESDIHEMFARVPGKRLVLPDHFAKQLDAQPVLDDSIVSKTSSAINASWKQWKLLNPWRAFRYNLNNMSGDLDVTVAADPMILKNSLKSFRDLAAFARGKATPEVKAELQQWIDLGVLQTGENLHEIPDISSTGAFRALTGGRANPVNKYWETVRGWTTLRENLTRLAAVRRATELIEKGQQPLWASNRNELAAITSPIERAAKLSRDLLGDYGNISVAGQTIRRRYVPFYSWMEINLPRYYRLFANAAAEGRTSRTAAAATVKGAFGLTKTTLKASLMFGAIKMFNAAMFPGEDDGSEDGRLRLLLGRNEANRMISVKFEGAFADALRWFGMADLPGKIRKLGAGEISLADIGGDMAFAPVNRIVNAAVPIQKTLLEGATGKSVFPDVRRPRAIRDTGEHIAEGLLDVGGIYRSIKDIPQPNQFMRSIFDVSDPEEKSYYSTRADTFKWLDKQGIEKGAGEPTKRSNALYYYRRATQAGNTAQAQRWMNEYKKLGGTDEGLGQSVKNANPLSAVPKYKQNEYIADLSPLQKKTLERAENWYTKTYDADLSWQKIEREIAELEYVKSEKRTIDQRRRLSKLGMIKNAMDAAKKQNDPKRVAELLSRAG